MGAFKNAVGQTALNKRVWRRRRPDHERPSVKRARKTPGHSRSAHRLRCGGRATPSGGRQRPRARAPRRQATPSGRPLPLPLRQLEAPAALRWGLPARALGALPLGSSKGLLGPGQLRPPHGVAQVEPRHRRKDVVAAPVDKAELVFAEPARQVWLRQPCLGPAGLRDLPRDPILEPGGPCYLTPGRRDVAHTIQSIGTPRRYRGGLNGRYRFQLISCTTQAYGGDLKTGCAMSKRGATDRSAVSVPPLGGLMTGGEKMSGGFPGYVAAIAVTA